MSVKDKTALQAHVTSTQKYRLIILGAGFSRPAGFPLAPDLWKGIREIVASSPVLSGHRFNKDLKHYIRFRKEADCVDLTHETVEFEDFMSFLDVEHYLGLRGGDTWSDDGNESTVLTKLMIGSILAKHVNALDDVPELYLEFAKRLNPRDTIITFNYDTLLERALDVINKPYRLFSNRFEAIHDLHNVVDDSRDEVIILKVHGSIDWFDRSSFQWLTAFHRKHKMKPPTDDIFSRETELGLERLVDGPRTDTDPLKNIYRAKNLKVLYAEDRLLGSPPRMLSPSTAKLVYANGMNDFWHGAGEAGSNNFGMAIIGFSLPPQDDYARQILYRLITNYQRCYWNEDINGLMKTPLVILDLFSNSIAEENFRKRYRFVDWSRADLIGSGFDLNSFDKIFA